jgi:uncharacterized membrane protein
MTFENPLFIIPLSTGIILMITAFILKKYPPKKINGLYGYRTRSSMLSQERWDFSQQYSAKELMKSGAVLALSAVIGLIYHPGPVWGTILGIGLLLLTTVIMMIRVEKAIKDRFDNEDQIS